MDAPVKVHVRIKPDEKVFNSTSSDSILVKLSSTKLEFNQEKEFCFDYVYESDSNQKEVFEKSALPLLEQLALGYNVTIMAYGPTGSGKSYTLGTSNSEETSQNEGLLAQIVSWIFSKKECNEEYQISKVQISFLEIYKEEVFDLLSPNLSKIDLKNDKVENVVMEDVKNIDVQQQVEALDVIRKANLKRQVKKTKSNDSSSRSHAIITINLEVLKNGESRVSRMRLVDLAGSEAVAKDGVIGEVKNEGILINKGLLALGKVINALNTKNVLHIPHRESTLTRALKDSLSGNSLTVLICCVKSDVPSLTMTSAALQFAAKAKAIKTKVQPSVFKTPFKQGPASRFKTPNKTPFKTPGLTTPYRTPLAQIQRNKVVTPGGTSFAIPGKICVPQCSDELDESILVSGSYKRNYSKISDSDDIENRIQMAVMERVDTFLESFRDKLAQSLLANCTQNFTTSQSIMESSAETNRNFHNEPEALNLTSAFELDGSLSVDNRRRSARIAKKRMTLCNTTTVVIDSKESTRSVTAKTSKKAAALPLPTPEGRSEQHMINYRKNMLHYLNHASQSQMQKLPSVGPKAGHSIITYRNLNGHFQVLETLKLVPGLRKNFYDTFIKVNILE